MLGQLCLERAYRGGSAFKKLLRHALEWSQSVIVAKEACSPAQYCVQTTGSRGASRKQLLLPLSALHCP